MTTDSDRLDKIKSRLEIYRESGISPRLVIQDEDVEWLINRVEELEGKLARMGKEQHELLEDYKDYRLKHDDYYSLGGE